MHRRTFIQSISAGSLCLLPFVRAQRAGAADLELTNHLGKVVYLDFWASWCGPCREAFPWLGDMMRHFGPSNLVVIGINLDKQRERAERFLNETPASFPIVYDPQGELATRYKVTGMPAAVLVDRQGRVRFQHSGFSAKKKDAYEDDLRTLVAEPALKDPA